MTGIVEWAIFLGLSGVALVTAAGMLLTMSMYRAGLALMSSFVALAGLFILLDADLLAAIQIMMNVGGMLIMVLFMVMIMMDPGGEMMWEMKRSMRLRGPGALSMRMPRRPPPGDEPSSVHDRHEDGEPAALTVWTCPMHPEVREPQPGRCPICGMDLVPAEPEQQLSDHTTTYTCLMHPEIRRSEPGTCPMCGMTLIAAERGEQSSTQESQAGHDDHHEHQAPDGQGAMTPRQHYQMMVDMAMSTAQLPWAIALAVASMAALVLLVARTPWPVSGAAPGQDATEAVGELLLSRYMLAFEGAAFLILAGITAAVVLARRETAPEPIPASPLGAVEGGTYTCPMHPDVREPRPGRCPICGMDLIAAPGRELARERPPAAHDHHGGNR